MDIPSNKSVLNWLPVMVILILIGLVATFVLLQQQPEPAPEPELVIPQSTRDSLLIAVQEILIAYDLKYKQVTPQNVYPVQVNVSVPVDIPLPTLHLEIQDGIERQHASVLTATSDPVNARVLLHLGVQDSTLLRLSLQTEPELKREGGRIAIVIDDFGDRNDRFAQSFFDIAEAMTISIIPGLPYSQRIYQEARARGCEVMLHMPMEPMTAKFKKDGYVILADMTEPDVRKRMRKAIQILPDVDGMNNHMGSKITTNRRMMNYILEEIKPKNWYFLDSRTSHKSVAFDVAQSLDLRCGKRDVFIDANYDKEKIRAQVASLAEKAKSNGFAVGIGHCHRNTLDVLREEVPKLRERGFRFVYVSEVVR